MFNGLTRLIGTLLVLAGALTFAAVIGLATNLLGGLVVVAFILVIGGFWAIGMSIQGERKKR